MKLERRVLPEVRGAHGTLKAVSLDHMQRLILLRAKALAAKRAEYMSDLGVLLELVEFILKELVVTELALDEMFDGHMRVLVQRQVEGTITDRALVVLLEMLIKCV